MITINGWKLLKLIYALRAVGLSVLLEDIENALLLLQKYPDLSAKSILKTVFVRRHEEYPLFETVWNFMNQEKPALLPEDPKKSLASFAHQGEGTGNRALTLSGVSPLNPYKSLPDSQTLQNMISKLTLPDSEDFQEHLRFTLGQSGYFSWINSIDLAYSRSEITDSERQEYLSASLHWQETVVQALRMRKLYQENSWNSLREMHWKHKPLHQFSDRESQEIRQILRLMARKFASRPGRRKQHANHGTVCFSAAIKELVRGNGIIREIKHEKRQPQRTELVVLCDVSNSVAPFSDFFLYMIRSIRQRFRKVRAFLFIDSLWDITQETWQEDQEMGEQIRAWGRKNSSGYSDYGKVFREFSDYWLADIPSRSTLLILGDARNNFRPAQAEFLKDIKDRLKQIYWLNPLEEKEWLDRDNVLKEYRAHCSVVMRCRTIEDLQKITRQVLY